MRSENPEVQGQSTKENTVHRVVLPYKDQNSADAVKKQLSDLSKRIDHTLLPRFKSRKIYEDLKMCDPKPSIISQQCVVHNYNCDQVTCVMQSMSSTPADIHTNVLTNTGIQQSANT